MANDANGFIQNPWAAFGGAFAAPQGIPNLMGGSFADATQWMKAIDPAEIERKIQEMKTVELWLQSQLSMVQFSIQGLSLQKQSMEALHAANQSASAVAQTSAPRKDAPRKRAARKG